MSDRTPEFADIVRQLITRAEPEARAEIDALADADRRFGEGFAREKRERAVPREGGS